MIDLNIVIPDLVVEPVNRSVYFWIGGLWFGIVSREHPWLRLWFGKGLNRQPNLMVLVRLLTTRYSYLSLFDLSLGQVVFFCKFQFLFLSSKPRLWRSFSTIDYQAFRLFMTDQALRKLPSITKHSLTAKIHDGNFRKIISTINQT